jgi:hypothetical protein
MAEVPVKHFPRTKGQSKYGLSRTFRVLLDLLSIHYFLRFGSRPGHFFGGLGSIVTSIGLLILAYLGLLKFLGESIGNRPQLFQLLGVIRHQSSFAAGLLQCLLVLLLSRLFQCLCRYQFSDARRLADVDLPVCRCLDQRSQSKA